MNYRILGKTGIVVSEIGMGLEQLLDKDESTVINTIKTVIDGSNFNLWYNYIDYVLNSNINYKRRLITNSSLHSII